MANAKKELVLSDRETLIQVIDDLQAKLKKKKMELHKTRLKLNATKEKVVKMKGTVEFQRNRIIELYPKYSHQI